MDRNGGGDLTGVRGETGGKQGDSRENLPGKERRKGEEVRECRATRGNCFRHALCNGVASLLWWTHSFGSMTTARVFAGRSHEW